MNLFYCKSVIRKFLMQIHFYSFFLIHFNLFPRFASIYMKAFNNKRTYLKHYNDEER